MAIHAIAAAARATAIVQERYPSMGAAGAARGRLMRRGSSRGQSKYIRRRSRAGVDFRTFRRTRW